MTDRFEETAQMLWAHGSPPFGPEEAVLKLLAKTLRSTWDEAIQEAVNVLASRRGYVDEDGVAILRLKKGGER